MGGGGGGQLCVCWPVLGAVLRPVHNILIRLLEFETVKRTCNSDQIPNSTTFHRQNGGTQGRMHFVVRIYI